jgi:hypothetical protein
MFVIMEVYINDAVIVMSKQEKKDFKSYIESANGNVLKAFDLYRIDRGIESSSFEEQLFKAMSAESALTSKDYKLIVDALQSYSTERLVGSPYFAGIANEIHGLVVGKNKKEATSEEKGIIIELFNKEVVLCVEDVKKVIVEAKKLERPAITVETLRSSIKEIASTKGSKYEKGAAAIALYSLYNEVSGDEINSAVSELDRFIAKLDPKLAPFITHLKNPLVRETMQELYECMEDAAKLSKKSADSEIKEVFEKINTIALPEPALGLGVTVGLAEIKELKERVLRKVEKNTGLTQEEFKEKSKDKPAEKRRSFSDIVGKKMIGVLRRVGSASSKQEKVEGKTNWLGKVRPKTSSKRSGKGKS